MARYLIGRGRGVLTLGVAAAALAAACSSSTSPHHAAPCPSYTGGSATAAALAGSYTLVTFCQDTLPALGTGQGFTGSLTLTSSPDTFKAAINPPSPAAPVNIVGPYTVSHDTITVTLPPPYSVQIIVTYAFTANTLFVSGSLPTGGAPQPLAIVFFR